VRVRRFEADAYEHRESRQFHPQDVRSFGRNVTNVRGYSPPGRVAVDPRRLPGTGAGGFGAPGW
jgi:hypothetical protein